MDLELWQKEVALWRARTFRTEEVTLLGQAAGAVGEASEGMQIVLKFYDGRAELNSETIDQIMDAIGDTLIYFTGLCDMMGVTLEDCIERAWGEVQHRTKQNWNGITDERAAGSAAE